MKVVTAKVGIGSDQLRDDLLVKFNVPPTRVGTDGKKFQVALGTVSATVPETSEDVMVLLQSNASGIIASLARQLVTDAANAYRKLHQSVKVGLKSMQDDLTEYFMNPANERTPEQTQAFLTAIRAKDKDAMEQLHREIFDQDEAA